MSDLSQLPNSECTSARALVTAFLEGDLAGEQAMWLRGHLETCDGCRAALAAIAEIDHELTDWGLRLDGRNPRPPSAREQLASGLESRPVGLRTARWMPATIAAVAAVAAVVFASVVMAPHNKFPAAAPAQAQFIGIPYLPPLDPRENAVIVRMNIRVATLLAAGYKVTEDPDTIVPADVLVGEDGRAHAVRLLSAMNGIQ